MTHAYVRPDTAAFLAFLNNLPGPKMYEMAPGDARAAYRAMRPVADVEVGELAVIEDHQFDGPAGPLRARLYDCKANREPGPVVVFFHGGGFVIGDLDTHEPFCAEAARMLNMPVIAIDYRLAPECKWPAAPDDCEAAARWVAGSPAELGRTVTSLVLAGDSAGGNLAIVTTYALRDAPAAVPVIAQFPIYPAVDDGDDWGSFHEFAEGHLLTKETMDWFTASYGAEPAHPRSAPLHGDHTGAPPTLVLTASLDPLRDQGRAYAGALAAAGVPVTFREAAGNIHGFICLAKGIPSSRGDIAGALNALKDIVAEAEANRVMAQASAGAMAA